MDPFLFRLDTPEGRASAMRMALLRYPIPGRQELLEWLDHLVAEGLPPMAEWAFASLFRNAALGSETALGAAWRELEDLVEQMGRARRRGPLGQADAARLPMWRPQVVNFVWNLWSCDEALRTEPSDTGRLHIALSAITQINGLLWEHVRDMLIRSVIQTADEEAKDTLRAWSQRWVDLAWYPGLPLSFRILRNAWSHGDVWIDENALRVFSKGTSNEVARINARVLARYIDGGIAAWGAHSLYGAVMKATTRGEESFSSVKPTSMEEILAERTDLRQLLAELEADSDGEPPGSDEGNRAG